MYLPIILFFPSQKLKYYETSFDIENVEFVTSFNIFHFNIIISLKLYLIYKHIFYTRNAYIYNACISTITFFLIQFLFLSFAWDN